MIGNKIADKITSVSKKYTKESQNDETEACRSSPKDEGEASLKDYQKKRCISPEERQQIIDELRLVPKKDIYFLKLFDKPRLE